MRRGWALGARDQAPAEPPRPVIESYQMLSIDQLRGQLERVTAFLLGEAEAAVDVPGAEGEAA